jgi:hypothetical protein
MVSKRRSVKSGLSVTNDNNILQGEGEYCDTIRVQRPRNSKAAKSVTTPEPPVAILNSTPSSTGGMDDLSLTSPSVHETIEQDPVITPKQKRDMPPPERTLSSALRRLTAKAGTSKGSANNPIVLDEYSPRRKPIPLPKRVESAEEPHKFQSRHRKLYVNPTYRRPPLALKAANGIRFTGDKGSDLGRMINAKEKAITSTPAQTHAPPQNQTQLAYGIPFEVQYPMSAQYLATRTSPNGQYQSPYARYHSNMGVSISGDSEEMLRRKAVQYTRSQQPLSDDTRASTEPSRSGDMRPPSSMPMRTKKMNVYHDKPNDHITQLVAHSSLLTGLLQMYSKSSDKKGLREDIANLAKAQEKRVEEWIKHESPVTSDVATSRISEAESRKDDEVRNLLRSGARMWQDGSGEGVADVFAEKSTEEDVSETSETSKKRKLGVCGWDMEHVV